MRRIAGIVVLLLFTAVAVQAAVCELLCLRAADMLSAHETPASPACHEAPDAAAVPGMSAAAHGCTDHAADWLTLSVPGATPRGDGAAVPDRTATDAPGQHAQPPAALRGPGIQPPLHATPPGARELLTIVLRI